MAEPIVLRFQWDERLMTSGSILIRNQYRWKVLAALFNIRSYMAVAVVVVLALALRPAAADREVFLTALLFGMLIGAVALFLTADAQSHALRETEAEMRAARGEAVVTLSDEGAEIRQGGEVYALDWPSVTRVQEWRRGVMLFSTVFRSVPVPDEALPEGVTRADVLARVKAWRGM